MPRKRKIDLEQYPSLARYRSIRGVSASGRRLNRDARTKFLPTYAIKGILLQRFGTFEIAAKTIELEAEELGSILAGQFPIPDGFQQKLLAIFKDQSSEFILFLKELLLSDKWADPGHVLHVLKEHLPAAVAAGRIVDKDRRRRWGARWTNPIGFRTNRLPGSVCLYPGKTIKYLRGRTKGLTKILDERRLEWALQELGLLKRGRPGKAVFTLYTDRHTEKVWVLDERIFSHILSASELPAGGSPSPSDF